MPSPERVSWAKIRVAAVSVAALAILFTLIYLLSGGTLLEEKATLYVYIPDATGLSSDSPVTVDGINVGKVSSVALSGSSQPDRVIRVQLTVERTQLGRIPVDSYAAVDSLTMIGDKFIAITSGRMSNAIRPGAELPYREKADLTKRLDLRQFEQQIRVIEALLTDIEQGRSRVGQFILKDDVYRDVSRRLAQIQSDIRITTSTTTRIGEALHTDVLYRRFSDTVTAIDRDLAKLQSGQGPAGRFLRDPAQFQQLDASIQDFRKAVSDLRASDFVQSDAQYAQWNNNLETIMQSIQNANVNPFLDSTAAYEEYNGMARELRDAVNDFRTDPKKYLRLKVF